MLSPAVSDAFRRPGKRGGLVIVIRGSSGGTAFLASDNPCCITGLEHVGRTDTVACLIGFEGKRIFRTAEGAAVVVSAGSGSPEKLAVGDSVGFIVGQKSPPDFPGDFVREHPVVVISGVEHGCLTDLLQIRGTARLICF